MKNLSLALNAILLIAVAILYYLHFSTSSSSSSSIQTSQIEPDSSASSLSHEPSSAINGKILFINADSLFENYKYIKEIRSAAESRKSQLENTYQSRAQQLQKEIMEYQQKAQQGLMSLEEAKKTEEGLIKKRSDLESMEEQLGQLIDDTQTKNEELQKELNNYLKNKYGNSGLQYVLAYNQLAGLILFASDSLDITSEVISDLNKKYEAKKNNK